MSVSIAKLAVAVAAVTVLAGHVAPSVDDNNRYLKVTPLRDGIRVAYTVFFGEIPGAAERRVMDTNRDGRLDTGESKAYAQKLATQVGAAVDVELDGVQREVEWIVVDVGLGSDAVAAGAFSIDLVIYLCNSVHGPRHRVRLRDQFRIPKPGETEVKVEDSPGVTVHAARIGAHDDPSHDYRFVGPGGPLADDGLALEFSTGASTPTIPGGRCKAAAASAEGGLPTWLLVLIGTSVPLAAVVLLVLRRRR